MVGMGESTPALRTASWAVCFIALALGLFSAFLAWVMASPTLSVWVRL